LAKITLRLRDPGPEEFVFTELGGGKIAITPALDLLSEHGHFATEAVWRAEPDGWQRIGPISTAKIKAIKRALLPKKVAAVAATESGSTPPCECGDELGVHDPCSKCECPKYRPLSKGAKAKRWKKRR
jgi:hypothetical protein